ncbi:MAG: NAD(+) kinase, partial [Desulfocapsa sp.]|nr:NAD(+) kinase [Desulfocapsa sp.]
MPQLSEAFRTNLTLSLKHVGIVTKKDYAPATELAKTIVKRLKQRKIAASINTLSDDLDVLIILGGDGTLLHVA